MTIRADSRMARRWPVGLLATSFAASCPAPCFAQTTVAPDAAPSPGGNTVSSPSPARAATEEQPSADAHELIFSARTNVQGLQRALLPGPGGAIVETQTLAPFHQSLSMAAYRLDTPVQKGGLDLQVATYGQFSAGTPGEIPDATWDIATALATQHFKGGEFTLGRQVVLGGAARYRRMDGVSMTGRTVFGLAATVYGGLTALPRWDQWYGYHYLGDAYEQWSKAPQAVVTPDRADNWMGGFRLGWANPRYGALGVSFHSQAEQNSIENRLLGVNFSFTRIKGVGLSGDLIYTLEQNRWSDARLLGEWQVLSQAKSGVGLALRGEFLHTLPAALLSQASVLSVFSASDVTEAGGGLEARLPARISVEMSAFAQIYEVGDPGARVRLAAEYVTDEDRTLVVRLTTSRVNAEQNGYLQLRLAAVYRVVPQVTVASDLYEFFYDEKIDGRQTSTFAALHVSYAPIPALRTRLGGSVAQSPYAALDAQIMGQLIYEFAEYGR